MRACALNGTAVHCQGLAEEVSRIGFASEPAQVGTATSARAIWVHSLRHGAESGRWNTMCRVDLLTLDVRALTR